MRVIASTILLLLFYVLLVFTAVRCEVQLEYTIDINHDCSAKWTIQSASALQSFETFIGNIQSLVDEAKIKSGRNMSVTNFAMTTNVSGSYTIVKYQFLWTNFAINETNRIIIEDVFEVEGIFLFGEGVVNIVHPADYTVENVIPNPHDKSVQFTLTWWGIADFESGEPKITLKQKEPATILGIIQENMVLIIGLIFLIGAGSGSIYYIRTKKPRKGTEKRETQHLIAAIESEGDEEIITRTLRAAGGQLRQSTIVNQCKFSKAKTSILLSRMEEEGKVKRIEKGRQKIVVLIGGKERNSIEN